jgi:hypothetical protein
VIYVENTLPENHSKLLGRDTSTASANHITDPEKFLEAAQASPFHLSESEKRAQKCTLG